MADPTFLPATKLALELPTHSDARGTDSTPRSRRFRFAWTRFSVGVLGCIGALGLYEEVSQPRYLRPSAFVLELAQSLGEPTFLDIRLYERNLPQHTRVPPGSEPPRYLGCRISSLNNVLQEQLLNTHLAYLAERAYVFPPYVARDHPPFPDRLPNGLRHWLHVPMNAVLAGPTAGAPLADEDSLVRRAVSVEWWKAVCSEEDIVVVKAHEAVAEMGLHARSGGLETMDKWAGMLWRMSARCVCIEEGMPFDTTFTDSDKMLELWPSYSQSPGLKRFAWSPLITAALSRNFHLLGSDAPPAALTPTAKNPDDSPSYPPYRASAPPIPGLLGIHAWNYNTWNQLGDPGALARQANGNASTLPVLPDFFDVPAGMSRCDAVLAHCWPSSEAIIQRAHIVRRGAATKDMRRVYIVLNSEREWVEALAAGLRADGWEVVSSSFDLDLTLEEQAVAQAVDMSALASAESFIGVGFSSLTSNVVQIRLAGGREPRTIHFWPPPPRPPPSIPSSDITGQIGVPIHVCISGGTACCRCVVPQHPHRAAYNVTQVPGQQRGTKHRNINVCTANGNRPPNGVIPREIAHQLAYFDFTLQLSNLAMDPFIKMYNKSGFVADIGPFIEGSVRIRKPEYLPFQNSSMVMSLVNIQGPGGYVVEWVLQTADEHDVGMWGWYRKPPVLGAWKNPGEWHWNYHEIVSSQIAHNTEVAAIILICGITIYEGMGTSLTRTW
ncbi:hypothetical protein B0H16DRAFT_1710997 [Mycena metata]|uniref:Uncharacterized protein n=1 Tax=Mycena metata TaxID=1033252 RepID=A0AAD7NXW1_9AGAR|nr:hypothetical protein B0H16DRAFT_1710997 [Mycena metata]